LLGVNLQPSNALRRKSPPDGSIAHFAGPDEQGKHCDVHIHAALERERRLAALEAKAPAARLSDEVDVGRAVIHLELPTFRQSARAAEVGFRITRAIDGEAAHAPIAAQAAP